MGYDNYSGWDGKDRWLAGRRAAQEGTIQPTAMGKKNWLFIGDADTRERSAIIYTLIECCRHRGIDPQAYLRDILTRLPAATNQMVPEFIPAKWADARSSKLPKAA